MKTSSDLPTIAKEIRRMVSMKEVCELFSVEINRAGFCRCAFHADGRPSMKIYPGDRGFYCFSCGKGGDIFDFVMQQNGCDFKGAIELLIEAFNLPFTLDNDANPYETERQRKRLEAIRRQEEMRQADYELSLKEYEKWEMLYHTYVSWKEKFAPMWPDEVPDRRYIEACQSIDITFEKMKNAESRLKELKTA